MWYTIKLDWLKCPLDLHRQVIINKAVLQLQLHHIIWWSLSGNDTHAKQGKIKIGYKDIYGPKKFLIRVSLLFKNKEWRK